VTRPTAGQGNERMKGYEKRTAAYDAIVGKKADAQDAELSKQNVEVVSEGARMEERAKDALRQ
jgi:hypothetical protein